jgi:MFS family permease
MASATFPIIVASVLAAQLIDEFEISRAQVGFLVTAAGLVGALSSPLFGHLTDRLGAVRSVTATLAAGVFTFTAFALSPAYWVLVAAAVVAGLPNGWGNPSTNALIVDNTTPGSRGILTGIKQSGVQFGTFLGGMLLPLFSGWWSWRVAVLMFLVMPVGGLIVIVRHRDPNTHEQTVVERAGGRLPSSVTWIAIYGFISGLATQSIFVFVPLFANEKLGWTVAAAGTLLSIVGITGIAARLFWPRIAERSLGHGRTLRILAWLTTATAVLLWLANADLVPAWVLIPAVMFLGGGAVAWNAVGMLAVMDFAPQGLVGRGTGVVLFGFLLGLAIGPPLMGYSVDRLGTYGPGWLVVAVLLFVAALIAFKIPSPERFAEPMGSHR